MKRISMFLLTLMVISCGKNKEKKNQPPQSFSVSVSEVKPASAQLNWTVATDPENKAVTYTVELQNQVVANSISTTGFKLENLTENTSYSGKVIAKDPEGLSTQSVFNFSTANSPSPSAFSVTVTKQVYNKIEIFWTASTLPDNGTVYYDVYVNNSLKTTGSSFNTYAFTGLQPTTTYTIKVIARSSAGKTTESTVQGTTTTNEAPGSFAIQKLDDGVTTIKIEGAIPADPEEEQLTYFTIVNGVENQVSVTTGTNTFTYTVSGLAAAQDYDIAIKAKDAGGASSTSNTLHVTTFHAPENNFVIDPVAEGNLVSIEFITATLETIDLSSSRYLVGTTWKSLSGAQVTYTIQAGNNVKIKILINDTELQQGYNKKFQLNLYWAPQVLSTYSSIVYYTHFTTSTAVVSNALVKGPGAFPPQWTINFTNCVISDYTTWDIQTIVFDNIIFDNYAGFAICNPSQTGYYTGNCTADQYNYLKTKDTGYIIVQDAGGYHKLNFTYTTQD